MKKTFRLLALASAAALLFDSLTVLAHDASPPSDARPIVLAQVAQPKKPARGCAAGLIYCCKTYKKQETCGCNCGKKLIGKPQTLVP